MCCDLFSGDHSEKSVCLWKCVGGALIGPRLLAPPCSPLLVCADNNHVRTWTVTRFRGMISTQPGSTPLASFKILSLEETESPGSYSSGNDIGELAAAFHVPVGRAERGNNSGNLEGSLNYEIYLKQS